ncbi:MAG: 3-oxoacyl-[acyl-carrier-protein] synthase-3 [Bacteriovoracaceae bacterium]|jgi:3-oxoacyl-[acyl-carrier-protein] synthase III
MSDMNISLRAIAYLEPDEFISSDQIEKDLAPVYDRLKLPYGRIQMQTGIDFRGMFNDKKPSDISIGAAKNLFSKNSIKPEEIDLLVHASVCRDFLEPSTASLIHHGLGLRADCLSFDLSNACLGVVTSLMTAADMINSGRIKNALIVTGENAKPLLTKTIETLLGDKTITRKSIKKYFANFTIGSAGVAIVVTKKTQGLPLIHSATSLSDTASHMLCQGDGSTDSLVMETDSEELMQRGIALAKTNWTNYRQTNKKEIDHYICHQVGIHHRNFLYKSLELDLSKDHTSFDRYGNTGSAALPLTLALGAAQEKFKKGDEIALLGIGSGLHTQMLGVTW